VSLQPQHVIRRTFDLLRHADPSPTRKLRGISLMQRLRVHWSVLVAGSQSRQRSDQRPPLSVLPASSAESRRSRRSSVDGNARM